MDIANFDALKAQGRILDAANVDPEQDYFLLGKYTNKYTTDNFKYTKYPVWAIKAGDVMGVQSVTGLNTDNTDPFNPIVKISVDGVTITGEGTPTSPLVAVQPQPTYKVYTALLTQSGGTSTFYISSDSPFPLVVGVTYTITFNDGTGDFTNIGAPNNTVGTSFVATGTTPTNWGTPGDVEVSYNTGAPVVTVLENTIGNIWFTYSSTGTYYCNSNELFINNKVWSIPYNFTENSGDIGQSVRTQYQDSSNICILTNDKGLSSADEMLQNTPIEIRVYN